MSIAVHNIFNNNFITPLFFSYFRRPLNIFCEFIPEMIFMMAIFGYLIILMFYKWLAKDASKCAPSILISKSFNYFCLLFQAIPSSVCTDTISFNHKKFLWVRLHHSSKMFKNNYHCHFFQLKITDLRKNKKKHFYCCRSDQHVSDEL